MVRKTTRLADRDTSGVKPERTVDETKEEANQEQEPLKQAGSRTWSSRIKDKMTDPSFMVKGVTGTASKVVQQAASILEEEIAAGIVAAKKAEEQFINVKETRSGEPEEVLQRFRRDSHEVVDIVLDLVSAATKKAGAITQQVIKVQGEKVPEKSKSTASEQLPRLLVPRPVKAGSSAEVPMTLENSGQKPTERTTFHCTDLVDAGGNRLPASSVSFKPRSLIIAAQKSAKVTVVLNVPEGTPPGVYSGLVQASKLNQLRALLAVEVA